MSRCRLVSRKPPAQSNTATFSFTAHIMFHRQQLSLPPAGSDDSLLSRVVWSGLIHKRSTGNTLSFTGHQSLPPDSPDVVVEIINEIQTICWLLNLWWITDRTCSSPNSRWRLCKIFPSSSAWKLGNSWVSSGQVVLMCFTGLLNMQNNMSRKPSAHTLTTSCLFCSCFYMCRCNRT